MVFSSIPAYLDSTNWQQQTNHQSGPSSGNPHQLQTPTQTAPPPPGLAPPHGVGGAGSIRPGSMSERARLANIPMPEGPLKCPRCESTNTKFCYFNNYSLTQPRHFCKTCRRYWTRGGALRSVPVGGGCRRNKRSKSTSSKSTTSSNCDPERTSSSTNTVSSNTGLPTNILGLTSQLPPLRFLSPLGQLADHYNSSGELSLNYNSGISAPLLGTSEMNFHIGANLLGGGGGGDGSIGGGSGGTGGAASLLSSGGGGGGIEQWRMQQAQQFHFLSGLDQSAGGLFHQFQSGVDQSGGFVGDPSQVRPKLSTSFLSQMASVKVEDQSNQELNLSRQLLGISGNDHHQWSDNSNNNNTTTTWTDLTTFNSSSTSNPL